MSTRETFDYNMSQLPASGKSTRSSDLSIPPFDLFREIGEKGFVYLRVGTSAEHPLEFEASQGSVQVRMPIPLWNRLVARGPLPNERDNVAD